MAKARPLTVIHLPPTRTERDLVAAVRRGDDRAFEELFSRYQARIGSFVLRMVHDHGRTEDIVQDVFISALRRLRDTERPIAFKPWIYEIARNACIDEFRRIRRAHEVPLEPDQESGGADRDVPSRDPTPDDAVESKQRLEDLRGAFRGLSESHHRILVLREFEGLSYNEIGERMGMSRAVVESTLFRARRRLSEEYEELVSGRRCQQVRAVIDGYQTRTLGPLGIRATRQLSRHLAHCQSCRREAWAVGLDEELGRVPSVDKPAAVASLALRSWDAAVEDEVLAEAGSAA